MSELELDPDQIAQFLNNVEIEDTDLYFQEELNARIDIASMFYTTFDTETGQRSMKFLVQKFVLNKTFSSNDTQFGAGIKEGQRQLVLFLLECIQRHRTGDYNAETTNT